MTHGLEMKRQGLGSDFGKTTANPKTLAESKRRLLLRLDEQYRIYRYLLDAGIIESLSLQAADMKETISAIKGLSKAEKLLA